MQKVKIISGWTNPGGSTIALANLCDAFNERGIECSFFGPHDWHLDKCKNAKTLMDLSIESDDNIIAHYLGPIDRFNCKRVLLSSHEKWWYKVAEQKPYWDAAVFLHDAHREYHSAYKGDSYIIPNIKEDFEKKNKEHLDKVAGIIGTIEERKQTHQSIKRALADGCDKIYLFTMSVPSTFDHHSNETGLFSGSTELLPLKKITSSLAVPLRSSVKEAAGISLYNLTSTV